MIGIAANLTIPWDVNTHGKRLLTILHGACFGCAIGDLGTIAYFQFMGISWPVWSNYGFGNL